MYWVVFVIILGSWYTVIVSWTHRPAQELTTRRPQLISTACYFPLLFLCLPSELASYYPEFCLYCSLVTLVCLLYYMCMNTWIMLYFYWFWLCKNAIIPYLIFWDWLFSLTITLPRLVPLAIAVILLNRILSWQHCIRHVGYFRVFFHLLTVLLRTFLYIYPSTCEQKFLLGAYTGEWNCWVIRTNVHSYKITPYRFLSWILPALPPAVCERSCDLKLNC